MQALHLSRFAGHNFDFVISLCDKAQQECQQFTQGREHLAWNFEDPKIRSGVKPFDTTLKEIDQRIKMFVLVQCEKGQPLR